MFVWALMAGAGAAAWRGGGGGLLLVSDAPPYSPKLSQKENDNLVHCLHGIVGGPWLLLTE